MRDHPVMRRLRRCSELSFLFLLALAWSGAVGAANLCAPQSGLPNDHPFTVTTPRLILTVDNGRIVGVKNRASGTVHASATTAQLSMPTGLGHLTGDAPQAAGLHSAWGSRALPTQPVGCTSHCPYPPVEWKPYHHPFASSNLVLTSTTTSCTATWTGLTNGQEAFPTETLTIDFQLVPTNDPGGDAAGELKFRGLATSPNEGAFDVLVPIVNLTGDHRVYAPHFGGAMFDNSGFDGSDADTAPDPLIRTFHMAPFWDAPVVALEAARGSVGLWIEDATMRPNMFVFSWTGWTTTTFGVGIAQLNLMGTDTANPYPYTAMNGTWWHLDGYTGNWTSAMARYKAWYANTFSQQLTRRQSPAQPAAAAGSL